MILLTQEDVRALMSMPDCIDAVERVFRQHALGELPVEPGILGAHVRDGGFHIKTAALGGSPGYFVTKINANFPKNPSTTGLPTIQGVIALFDSTAGRPLALLDSIEITILRTAAASAVAARYLARAEASTVTIVGCGIQGRSHLRALRHVRPITRAYAFDADPAAARRFAGEMAAELGIAVTPTEELGRAIAASEICVTCTPARRPIISAAQLHPGVFIAAVGADHPEKQELEPTLLKRSKVVVDHLEQSATIGDLHHAIVARALTRADIHGTLGQVIAGQRPSRTSPEEMFVFDSTGLAIQDVAATVLVYERAQREGRGLDFAFV